MFKNWPAILRLALPSFISFMTVTVTGTISLIIVGGMGPLVIAAVGVSNIIMYNAWALCSGLGLTVNYLVAQNFGSGDMKKGVDRTFIALYLCIGLGVLLHLLALWVPGPLLRLMGSSPELVSAGTFYLCIRFSAMAFAVISFVFHGFLRGIGDTKTPMLLSIAGNAAMIFFTYTLTYGKFGFPAMGLPGAAWGLWIGEAVGLAGALYVFFVRLHPRYVTRRRVGIDRAEARLILQEGGKLGVQEFSLSVAMFVFTAFVTRLGTQSLAANEIALNIMSFGFMPAFAFSATVTILVGQAVGRGDPFLARRYATDTAIVGALFLLLLGTAEFFFAGQFAGIYTRDPEVAALAARLIGLSAFLQIFDGILNFYAGGLRGLGDTGFLLKASFFLSWLLFVPLAYLLTFHFGLGGAGAWIGFYTFLTVYALVVVWRFYKTDWSQVTVKVAEGG